ncbi:hypothetical protein CHUAL_005241 [Chamberlinius hualienensis]
MAPSRVRIVYEQPTATYFSGQILSGNVVIDYDKELRINEIALRVHGVARVDWTEKNNDQCYSNYEEFIDARMNIYDKGKDQTGIYESPGERSYPFTFQLPANLPSTFISSHGFVHYYCKAIVQTTEINCLTMSSKVKVQKQFNIIHNIDVDTFPNMNGVSSICQSQRLPTICCLSRGLLTISMSLNKRAFIIGESINIDYTIENRSSVHLVLLNVALMQKLLYTSSSGKKKSDNMNIADINRSTEILPHKDVEGHVTITIPMVPPNSLGICNSIAVSYCTLLSVGEISGCNPSKFYLEISQPIVIGTIRRSETVLPFG